jgi:hypothetical protein
MAQEQMTSLFGPTPQDLLRQQQQADQELAMRQAQLGPGQGLMYQAASAGQRAGRNIAGLFGVEDPRLKEASAMQELKTAINTQWDGTDPVEAYKIMAKEAARLGLTQQSLAAAMQVKQAEEAKTKTGLETRVKEAQINKYVADKKASEARAEAAGKPKTPEFVQLQNELSALETRLQSATDEAEADALLKRINTLKKKIDKESSFAPTAPKEPKSLQKVGVSTSGQVVYLDPNTNKQVTINAEGQQIPFAGQIREGVGPSITLNTPQTAALVAQGQSATKQITDRVSAIDSSLTLINKGTPFSEAALRQEISSIFGDANKAKTEIEALANTGSLDQRIANRITQFINGKDTKVTNEDRRAVLLALREKEKAQYERRRTPYVNAAKASNVNATEIFPNFDAAFGTVPGVAPSGTITGTTSTGTEYRVVKRGN